MDGYQLLLFWHVASVIVWLGVGTTMALIGLYAGGHGDKLLVERLRVLGPWLGPRVFAPASIGSLASGLALTADGHWGLRLWNGLGLVAFAASALLTAGVRQPLERRLGRGVGDRERAARLLGRLPPLELTVLYLTVADMVGKPSTADRGTLAVGAAIVVAAVAVVLAAAFRPVRTDDIAAR